jgi:hypothetical protein
MKITEDVRKYAAEQVLRKKMPLSAASKSKLQSLFRKALKFTPKRSD